VQKRILVSEDRDFGDLTIRQQKPAIGVVLAKVGEFDGTLDYVGAHVAKVIDRLGQGLVGAFTVIEPGRVRQRALPNVP